MSQQGMAKRFISLVLLLMLSSVQALSQDQVLRDRAHRSGTKSRGAPSPTETASHQHCHKMPVTPLATVLPSDPADSPCDGQHRCCVRPQLDYSPAVPFFSYRHRLGLCDSIRTPALISPACVHHPDRLPRTIDLLPYDPLTIVLRI